MIANHSLHDVLRLEPLFAGIRGSLRTGGVLLVWDMIGRIAFENLIDPFAGGAHLDVGSEWKRNFIDRVHETEPEAYKDRLGMPMNGVPGRMTRGTNWRRSAGGSLWIRNTSE